MCRAEVQMKVELLGRDTATREEKEAMEELRETSKNAAAYKEEAKNSKARLLAVEEQLKKKDKELQKKEDSLSEALAQVKSGVVLLEQVPWKVKQLESDLMKSQSELTKSQEDLKAKTDQLSELEEKQKDDDYLEDAFRQTEVFISFTQNFSNEGFHFALAKASKMWPELDLGPLKLAYPKVWTTMSDGTTG